MEAGICVCTSSNGGWPSKRSLQKKSHLPPMRGQASHHPITDPLSHQLFSDRLAASGSAWNATRNVTGAITSAVMKNASTGVDGLTRAKLHLRAFCAGAGCATSNGPRWHKPNPPYGAMHMHHVTLKEGGRMHHAPPQHLRRRGPPTQERRVWTQPPLPPTPHKAWCVVDDGGFRFFPAWIF